jgi:putative nucleotidyltransferase with HDIG domain
VEAPARAPLGVRENITLAKTVVGKRASIKSRLLDSIAPADEQTIILHALSDSLIDRFARAADGRSWVSLLQWAEATCNRRARPSVRRLFQSFVPAVTDETGAEHLHDLETALSEIVQRIARTQLENEQAGGPIEVVDEVDLLCSEMLQRIESNDPKTAEHCRAVSAWCARIARRMSLTRAETTLVARGGLIHDVGKSKVPLEILNAPRKLSETEMDVMRGHAVVGYEIVKTYPKLTDIAGLVRSHHERYDGRGYPDRLDRASIPMQVRIVSVADTFNAMIGRRPYRAPFSPSRAIAELQSASGTQLDPDVVRALLDVITGSASSTSAAA